MPSLAVLIRGQLEQGSLPRVDGQVTARHGSGAPCACCGGSVDSQDVEYVPASAPQLVAHRDCFQLWFVESQRVQKEPARSPSRGTICPMCGDQVALGATRCPACGRAL